MKASKSKIGFAFLMMGIILALGATVSEDFFYYGIISGIIGTILMFFDKDGKNKD